MNREAQSIVLLLVGGAVLRISLSDVYLRYVKEGLRPFLIVSGVLLVLIALATLWREFIGRREPEVPAAVATAGTAGAVATTGHAGAGTDAGHAAESLGAGLESEPVHGLYPDDDGHGHAHGGPMVAWLLVLPVFAVFLIAPPALGSYAAGRAGTATVQEQSDFSPLGPGDPVKIAVVEYATRAIWDKGRTLRDRNIKLSGFLTPRPGGGFYLARIILSCCAADGRPIKVALSGDVPSDLEADMWVEVVGVYDKRLDRDPANGGGIPYMNVSELHRINAPSQPYEQ